MTVSDLFEDRHLTITSLLERRFLEEPDAEWCQLVDSKGNSKSVSVRELLERAMAYARCFGKPCPDRMDVGICLYHGIDLHAAFIGALWAGHIPAMVTPPSPRMDPEKYSSNLRHILDCIKPTILVLDSAVRSRLGSYYLKQFKDVAVLDPDDVPETGRIRPWEANPEDVALIQHSSGTTGLQKGVALSHRAIIRHHYSYAERTEMTTADVIVSWLPLYHDMGLIACFLLPLSGRMRLVQMSPFDWVIHPHLLFEQIHRYSATLCWMPNFAYSFLAQRVKLGSLSSGLNLRSIRAWINCSEPVYHTSHREFVLAFANLGVHDQQLTACYAMAENVFAITQSLPGAIKKISVDPQALVANSRAEVTDKASARVLVSNGSPVSGTHIKVVDDHDRQVSEGEIGQILIKGSTLFTGYHNRDDFTKAAFTSDGWYRTGDIGFVQASEVYVTGRKKDLLIIQGRNFHPNDIEQIAGSVPGVAAGRCVAFGLPDTSSGTEKLLILAELEKGQVENPKSIILKIRRLIAQELDCTPSLVQIVPSMWIVKTSSGKTARNDNREKWLSAQDLSYV